MEKIISTILSLLICFYSFAQNTAETEIRKLEDAQREAFLKKDTAKLFKLFSPDFVVNAPTNKITTLQQLKLLMQKGEVDMEVFERIAEKVTFNNTSPLLWVMKSCTQRVKCLMPVK